MEIVPEVILQATANINGQKRVKGEVAPVPKGDNSL